MATVTIDGSDLVIEQSAAEKVLSLKSSLRVPLSRVQGVTRDETIGSEAKGVRAPGVQLPGVITAGTFYREGRKTFWNIRDGRRAIVITLHDAEFDQLVIDVDDPLDTIAALNEAIGGHRRD